MTKVDAAPSADHNPYGGGPGTGISLPPYFRPTPYLKNNNAYFPGMGEEVRMPASTSFPSGHAASGFAFATAIGREQPWPGLALQFVGAGQAVAGLMDRLPPAPIRSRSVPDT